MALVPLFLGHSFRLGSLELRWPWLHSNAPAVLQAFRRVAEEEMKVRAAGLPKREDLMVHKLQELCVMAVREPFSLC